MTQAFTWIVGILALIFGAVATTPTVTQNASRTTQNIQLPPPAAKVVSDKDYDHLWTDIVAQAVVVPPEVPTFRPPDHVTNRPEGPEVASLRTAAWNAVFATWTGWNGTPKKLPDWCGKGPAGQLIVVFYDLVVQKVTGGTYRGLAVILNGVTGPSTSVVEMRNGGPQGKPAKKGYEAYTTIPCPPPFSPAY